VQYVGRKIRIMVKEASLNIHGFLRTVFKAGAVGIGCLHRVCMRFTRFDSRLKGAILPHTKQGQKHYWERLIDCA
jgi:hypothetical protein